MKESLRCVTSRNLLICEDEKTYKKSLGKKLDEDKIQSYGLYLVILKRTIKGLVPFTFQFHVIAENEEAAISQVESCCFPELKIGCPVEELSEITEKKATRIPFFIRGWGRETF